MTQANEASVRIEKRSPFVWLRQILLNSIRHLHAKLARQKVSLADDPQFFAMLGKHGLLTDLESGVLHCVNCLRVVNRENVAGIVFKEGVAAVFCDTDDVGRES